MARIDFSYKPLGVHAPFHQSLAAERLLVGAFGSGKTWGLMAEAQAIGLEQPGAHIMITRKTVPELRDTTEQVFFEILPPELRKKCKILRSGGHVESCTFPNGTKYIFRSMPDWNEHRSLNLAWIVWDEFNEFSEEEYNGMMSRIRQVTPLGERNVGRKITRRGMIMATNPNGHDWIWKRFVNEGTRYPNTAWFKSTSFDNPFLPASFIEQLLQYPEPWIKRYVLCQFDDFSGQVYEDWSWEHNMIDPIPREKLMVPEFWMAFDPGMRANTGAVWGYVDRANNRIVITKDYLGSGTAAAHHAGEFRRIEHSYKMGGHVRRRIADPNIMERDKGTARDLHSYYQAEGFNFTLGPRSAKVRIPALQNMVANRNIVVMRGTEFAERTAEQIAGARWKDLTPQQKATGIDAPEQVLKKDMELPDCCQYLATQWLVPAKLKKVPVKSQFEAEVWANVKNKLARAGKAPAPAEGVIL